MEFLSETILWWHWIVLGIVLVAAEILIPSFIVIWFGVAAIIVGAVDYLYQTSFTNELFLWAALSLVMVGLYYLYFRRKEPVSHVGQSEGEYADIPGIIIEDMEEGRYRARFDLPVLGDRVWIVESEKGIPLKEGDHIKVDRVYGQIIKVTKLEGV